MKKHLVAATLIPATLLSLGCTLWAQKSAHKPAHPKKALKTMDTKAQQIRPEELKAFSSNLGQFSLDLYTHLKELEGNTLFSPYSLSKGLSMALAGAQGQSEAELLKVLHFKEEERVHATFERMEGELKKGRGPCQLNLSSSLFIDKGAKILESYQSRMKQNYGSTAQSMDSHKPLETANAINAWVSQETEKRITKLVLPRHIRPGLTRIALLNAVYFKGAWEKGFDKAKTTDQPFYLSEEKSVDVPTMVTKGTFRYTEQDEAQLLELPYKQSQLSLLLILPKDLNQLKSFEKNLSVEKLQTWMNDLDEREVDVQLPRFSIRADLELKKTLTQMGLKEVFSNGQFPRLTPEALSIDDVLHGAVLEVNEEGTVAAAATAVVMSRKASMNPRFQANHAFLFMLRDRQTGAILFMGRLSDPQGQAK